MIIVKITIIINITTILVIILIIIRNNFIMTISAALGGNADTVMALQ